VGILNDLADHPLNRLVPLIEEASEQLRVAINAKRQLGQVVGADRKAVEALGESGS
jgi:hypothetical protein